MAKLMTTPIEKLKKAIRLAEEDKNMTGRWIDLDSPEVQELIIEDEYGNQMLMVDELDEIAHIFPTRLDKDGVLCL